MRTQWELLLKSMLLSRFFLGRPWAMPPSELGLCCVPPAKTHARKQGFVFFGNGNF